MTILAHWTRHANAKQLIALGSDLVRSGVTAQLGRESPSVYIHYSDVDDAYVPRSLPASKWVA